MSAAVILSFFSPAEYELPKRHFHSVVQTLNAQGFPLVITQAVLPGQAPQDVPSSIAHRVFRVPHALWLKEALWNAAVKLTDARHLVFLDADIVFSSTEWLDRTISTLSECDITQPYEDAVWLDRSGLPAIRKPAGAVALVSNALPSMSKYHPGFAWAMTRDAWQRLGGVYDRNTCGGNDSAFFFALSDADGLDRYLEYFGSKQDRTVKSPSWKSYRKNATRQRFRFGVTKGVTATHLWHGERKDRHYQTREAQFRRNSAGEFDILRRSDGMIEWVNPSDSKAAEDYFTSRREDG